MQTAIIVLTPEFIRGLEAEATALLHPLQEGISGREEEALRRPEVTRIKRLSNKSGVTMRRGFGGLFFCC